MFSNLVAPSNPTVVGQVGLINFDITGGLGYSNTKITFRSLNGTIYIIDPSSGDEVFTCDMLLGTMSDGEVKNISIGYIGRDTEGGQIQLTLRTGPSVIQDMTDIFLDVNPLSGGDTPLKIRGIKANSSIYTIRTQND